MAEGFDLGTVPISADSAMQKVIDAQARAKALQRENAALRKDRDDLLSEHTDFINRQRVAPTATKRRKAPTKQDKVRVSFGDMHGLGMDRPAVDALLDDMRRLDPDEIIIGGDMLECGGWLAKHQPIGFVASCGYTYQDDIEATNWFLDELAKAAPKATAVYLEGNHEDRVERWIVDQTMANKRDGAFLMSFVSPQVRLRLAERGIEYVRRSDVKMRGLPPGWIKLGKMFYTHELSSGKTAAAKAVSITAGNVTFFHTHQVSSATVVLPAVGVVKGFCPGCLCLSQPLWHHSLPTNWSLGYNIEIIAKSENFQHIHVPIWDGESLGCSLLDR